MGRAAVTPLIEPPPEHVTRIGMIARWRPVHRGHTPVLRALCTRADHVLIGIGSANRYNLRNPFTLGETVDMLRLALADHANYTLIPLDDRDDIPRWKAIVIERFGPLDLFVTDNPYVTHLLADDYPIIRPVMLVPEEERIAIDGTMVRKAMAQGDGWVELVPKSIGDYIKAGRIDERFRREFGLQTLALETLQ